MILLINNYSSFSYNPYQFANTNYPDIRVVRNDGLSMEQARELASSHIILSPGPGYSGGIGICIEIAKELGQTIPLLSVCLGHQAVCGVYEATASHAKQLTHGKQSVVTLDMGHPLPPGLPKQIKATRYHSPAAIHDMISEYPAVTTETDDGEIMAVMCREFPIHGMQFHPESVLTGSGIRVIQNLLAPREKCLS